MSALTAREVLDLRDAEIAKGFTAAAVDAILRAWPDQAAEIFADWEHYHVMGCYGFRRWGHFVGVEYDGYIHS